MHRCPWRRARLALRPWRRGLINRSGPGCSRTICSSCLCFFTTRGERVSSGLRPAGTAERLGGPPGREMREVVGESNPLVLISSSLAHSDDLGSQSRRAYPPPQAVAALRGRSFGISARPFGSTGSDPSSLLTQRWSGRDSNLWSHFEIGTAHRWV